MPGKDRSRKPCWSNETQCAEVPSEWYLWKHQAPLQIKTVKVWTSDVPVTKYIYLGSTFQELQLLQKWLNYAKWRRLIDFGLKRVVWILLSYGRINAIKILDLEEMLRRWDWIS